MFNDVINCFLQGNLIMWPDFGRLSKIRALQKQFNKMNA